MIEKPIRKIRLKPLPVNDLDKPKMTLKDWFFLAFLAWFFWEISWQIGLHF